MASASVLARVDHLVYAAADLASGIAEIERLLGVRVSPGGQHPAWGTRNALVALGPTSYLEIIAPDPEQAPPAAGRPFGLDEPGRSRLVAWAANGHDLEQLRSAAAAHGVDLGQLLTGSRRRPDGVLLGWQLTDMYHVVAAGIVPFFIDWGASPHPARAASQGARLVALRAEHPDADRVRGLLSGIGLGLPVGVGPAAALIAVIDCLRGRVELR